MVEYKHSLTKKQVRPLAKLANRGGGPLMLADDLNLPRSEYTNFSKLAYWGLVEKCDNKERGGKWKVTPKGWQFVRGEIRLRRTVWSYRGEIVRTEGPEVGITEVTGGWQYRPQYAREAVAHHPGGDPQAKLV